MEFFLNRIKQYIELTEAEKSILLSKAIQRNYLKGQYIVQAGDINKCQIFILSGTVKTFYADNKGNEHVVGFGIEGHWVGDIQSFSTQTPAAYNTQCLESTTVIQISYKDMEELYNEIPLLDRYFRIIIQTAYGNMSRRIVRNHSLTAKERYLHFLESQPKIAERVSQYLIASYLGITKEFLSNIRKQLATGE